MDRDQQRAQNRSEQRTAYDDNSIYKPPQASQPEVTPRRRRSQASRLQSETEDMQSFDSPYSREPQPREAQSRDAQYAPPRDASPRSGRRRGEVPERPLPERPRMRQYAQEDLEDTDRAEREARYERILSGNKQPAGNRPRPSRASSQSAPPSFNNEGRKMPRPVAPILEDDYDDDDDYDEERTPVRKSGAKKWIIIAVVVVLILGGVTAIGLLKPDLIAPIVSSVRQMISGPDPTVEPTPEIIITPSPEPTEEPAPSADMAFVNKFSYTPETELAVGDTVTFTIETSMLTDRVYVVDGNGQRLVEAAGEDQYIDRENGRIWTMMYTFIAPYEGELEAYPGNASGWNEANGSKIDILVIDPDAGTVGNEDVEYCVQSSVLTPQSASLTESIFVNKQITPTFSRAIPVELGAGAEGYGGTSPMNGVSAYRSNNLRQNAAFGTIAPVEKKFESAWMTTVGNPTDGGRMWNVQPLIVQWHANIREVMPLADSKKDKSNLKEVIFASNDGSIYFVDLEDGAVTRDKVALPSGMPTLSTPSIFPNGIPLMFVGLGDPANLSEDMSRSGLYMYNFIDSKFEPVIGGINEIAPSSDATFLTSPLIDVDTKTIYTIGGNGILYTTSTNVEMNPETFSPMVSAPTTEMYIAKPTEDTSAQAQVYSMLAMYNDIAYYATQGGVLVAVNVNTLQTEWALELAQETDAAISLDQDASGNVFVYVASRPDGNGNSHVRRIEGLTGSVVWDMEITGSIGSSVTIGENGLSDLLFVSTEETPLLYALRKDTGELEWAVPLMSSLISSSPLAVYEEDGTGYIVQGDENIIHLSDGLTGEIIDSLAVEGTIVGSPAAFENMVTVCTNSGKLYGIRIK